MSTLSFIKLYCFLLFVVINNDIILAQPLLHQQTAVYEPTILNPAMAGADKLSKLTLSHSRQWVGLNGAPQLYSISGHKRLGHYDFYNPEMKLNKSNLSSYEKIGLAANISTITYGPFAQTSISGSYAYYFQIRNGKELSFGITGKLDHLNTNGYRLEPNDQGDPLTIFENFTKFNTILGMYYNSSDLYGGLSILNLLSSKDGPYFLLDHNLSWFFLLGYRKYPPYSKLIIEPILQSYYIAKKFYASLNLKVYYNDFVWLSSGYSLSQQYSVMMAVKVYRSLYIGYSYVSPSRELTAHLNGSHSIVLGYQLGITKKPINNK